jgi:4-amino-4-deoxy-L-arabinose transferase-like glycosyltransferase
MTTRTSWPTLTGLSLLILLGGFLRLYHLGERSVTHVEMYVPGIRLPHGISYPEERLTLVKVVTSTLNSDTHPPAFYILMWFWTKAFGVSTWSMRLPSALLGTACIPLVFWLGMLTRQPAAGWLAAVLVAVNGHLVFWSQIARMFTLACCLGLLATILLLQIAKQDRATRTLYLLYAAIMLLGLCTHIFFWLILAAHMFWTLATAWGRKLPLPGAARLQFLVLILGSPLLASSAYQNGNTLAALSSNVLVYAREYLQFGFVFPLMGYSSGVFPDRSPMPLTDDPHLSLMRWLFFVICLVLFFLGAFSSRRTQGHYSSVKQLSAIPSEEVAVATDESRDPYKAKLLTDTSGPSLKGWLLAAVLAALAILFFVFVARTYAAPPNPTLRTSEKMVILPFLLALAAVFVQRIWIVLSGNHNDGRSSETAAQPGPPLRVGFARNGVEERRDVVSRGRKQAGRQKEQASRGAATPQAAVSRKRGRDILASGQALVLILAVLPFAMLALVSLFKPIFNARGLILAVPYLLLVLAAGIVRFVRYRILAALVLLAIGIAHYFGLEAYRHASAGRADYKSFAAALVPKVESSDLVFLTPEFFSTPLFYYMTSDWNHIVGRNYEAACRDNPHARIWALQFHNYEPQLRDSMARALSNYHVVQTVDAPGGQASLYVPNSDAN